MKSCNTAIVKIVCTLSALIVSLLLLTSCSLADLFAPGGAIDPNSTGVTLNMAGHKDAICYDNNTDIAVTVRIDNVIKDRTYDYIELVYISTENITIEVPENNRIEYSKNRVEIPVKFSVKPSCKEISLVYSETKFEGMVIVAKIYKNEELVERTKVYVTVLATNDRVYAGTSLECFDAYIKYLYDNKKITAEDKSDAEHTVFTAPAEKTYVKFYNGTEEDMYPVFPPAENPAETSDKSHGVSTYASSASMPSVEKAPMNWIAT